jgi:Asp-tRNA(Asn)/Glu-tRNA(Gln) amidotransferase B subunit
MAKQWEVVIGLETHTQLSTQSKIFSGTATQFGAAPNTQASPVDLALPGTLPVMNRGAVERAIQFGLAIGATVAPRSIFARKNYFYPDLPKGYQISQYEIPVVQGGRVTISGSGRRRQGRTRRSSTHARAPRRRRRQIAARRLRGHDRHRSESRRHAVAGNRHRAGNAQRGRSGRLCQDACTRW